MTEKRNPGACDTRAKADQQTSATSPSIESLFADQAAPKLRALDLFSGAGGATRGLQLAGFHVTGVDNVPQPRNPAERFIRADALALSVDFIKNFSFCWASPPCQRYTSLRHAPGKHRDVDLIGQTRELLVASGVPYVIENVVGAPFVSPITLCGTMFGLATPDGAELRRHRLIEYSVRRLAPKCQHRRVAQTIGVYGSHYRDVAVRPEQNHQAGTDFSPADARVAMGVDWEVTGDELSQMIPPRLFQIRRRPVAQPIRRPTGRRAHPLRPNGCCDHGRKCRGMTMKMSQFFVSPFLKGADFEEGETRTLTIKSVDEEEVGKEKEQKVVVHFREEEKGWVLNKTNWRTIEKVYGDTVDWPGKRIELFGAWVEFGGEQQLGIRVRVPRSPPPAPSPLPPPKSDPIDDDIPF